MSHHPRGAAFGRLLAYSFRSQGRGVVHVAVIDQRPALGNGLLDVQVFGRDLHGLLQQVIDL